MNFFQWLQQMIQEIWEGAARIFGPSDDKYPETGVQPFEGDPNEGKE